MLKGRCYNHAKVVVYAKGKHVNRVKKEFTISFIGKGREGPDTKTIKGNKRCYNKTTCQSNRDGQVYC